MAIPFAKKCSAIDTKHASGNIVDISLGSSTIYIFLKVFLSYL